MSISHCALTAWNNLKRMIHAYSFSPFAQFSLFLPLILFCDRYVTGLSRKNSLFANQGQWCV